MVAAREGPAVKPQAGLWVVQIFHVQQELPLCFREIILAAEEPAYLRERQDAHHQRVIPELLRILAVENDVLQPAFFRAWHFVHHPFAPHIEVGQVSPVTG